MRGGGVIVDQVDMLRRELFGADRRAEPLTGGRGVAKVVTWSAAKIAGARAVLLRESSTGADREKAFETLREVVLRLIDLAVTLTPALHSAHAEDAAS